MEDDCEDNCLPEGIEFLTQSDIDNFQTTYPNCTEILGDVTIGEQWYSSNITNLDGLNVLTGIGGYLDIRLNDNLASLSGLSNLTFVGGLISVFNNDALTDLTGLDQITYVNGNLYITYNDALTSLTGLENLTSIDSEFTIGENTVLPRLDGLESLNSVGSAMQIGANTMLNSIEGLSGLTSIGDYLYIIGNSELTSLEGLEGLTSIPGYLRISFNPTLSDLTGLDNLTSINGYLYIMHNDNLISLAGLDNIEANSISDLYINDNASLSVCDIESVCDYLAAPNGAIYITNNATGCANQEEVEDECFIGVPEMNSMDHFSISPNPVSGSANILLVLREHGLMNCDLFEVSGVRIKQLINEEKPLVQHS